MKRLVVSIIVAAFGALAPPASASQLNISTRAFVGSQDSVLIGGFIITGNDPKRVVIRAIGPSLAALGVPGTLDDPIVVLRDINGGLAVGNDNWMDNSSADQMTLIANGLAPADERESTIVTTLDPGAYTAVVSGMNDGTGVGLVEAYDLDGGSTDSKLANISTRGFVWTGDNVMIAGIILGGGSSTVIVRGIIPALEGNIPIEDPMLALYNANGDLIGSNDNWMDDPNAQIVEDAGLDPSLDLESALYKVLPAGAYTAILSDAGPFFLGGLGLVESYNLD